MHLMWMLGCYVYLVGVAVIQIVNPGAVKTCQKYADTLSLSYVSQQLSSAKRVHYKAVLG